MTTKVDQKLFKKTMELLGDRVETIDSKVETTIPAMQNELRRGLKAKVDIDDLDKQMEEKADKEFVSKLLDRLNKIEETNNRMAEKLKAAGDGELEEDDDDEVEEGEEGADGSPGIRRKTKGDGGGAIGGVSKAAVEELTKNIEEMEKRLMEVVQRMQDK